MSSNTTIKCFCGGDINALKDTVYEESIHPKTGKKTKKKKIVITLVCIVCKKKY